VRQFLGKASQEIQIGDMPGTKNALQSFLSKTYIYSGGGVLTSLTVATAFSHSAMLAQSPMQMFFGGFGLSLAGIAGLRFGKYEKDSVNMTTSNDPLRLMGFAALVTGMGVTAAPAFAMFDLAYVLPPSLLMTNFIFCGATIYARYAKPGSFLKYGPALTGGLLGLVGTSLVGLGSELIMGPNMFSALAHNVDLYMGIPLFTGFVAYDTHVAMERFARGDADHLGASVAFYLDFMNILIRVMEIVGKYQKNRNN